MHKFDTFWYLVLAASLGGASASVPILIYVQLLAVSSHHASAENIDNIIIYNSIYVYNKYLNMFILIIFEPQLGHFEPLNHC